MARCTHSNGNIQSFTEVCLDCGHNIYETDEEYERTLKSEVESLRRQLNQANTNANIDALEAEKAELLRKLGK
jgi:hypothetical protein